VSFALRTGDSLLDLWEGAEACRRLAQQIAEGTVKIRRLLRGGPSVQGNNCRAGKHGDRVTDEYRDVAEYLSTLGEQLARWITYPANSRTSSVCPCSTNNQRLNLVYLKPRILPTDITPHNRVSQRPASVIDARLSNSRSRCTHLLCTVARQINTSVLRFAGVSEKIISGANAVISASYNANRNLDDSTADS
jgi:hypothetical protein